MLGCPAFSLLQGRGNVVLRSRVGVMFLNSDFIPTPPFSQEEKPERERQDPTWGGEGVKANILCHWQQLLISGCFTWEKIHSEICTNTHTEAHRNRTTNHKYRPRPLYEYIHRHNTKVCKEWDITLSFRAETINLSNKLNFISKNLDNGHNHF